MGKLEMGSPETAATSRELASADERNWTVQEQTVSIEQQTSMDNRKPGKGRRWLTIFLALIILLPSFYGFGTKLLEFIALLGQDEDGAFALMPVVNYLLASIGFFLMFAWATLGGMFSDVERPKYTMLEQEQLLNEEFPRKPIRAAHN